MNSARVTGPAPFAGAGAGLSDTEAIVVFLSGLLDAGQVGEIGVELAAEVFEGVKSPKQAQYLPSELLRRPNQASLLALMVAQI